MSDISEFLQSYRETLQREIAGADMPPELSEEYTFDSCVKRQDGREVYFVTSKRDRQRAVLRINDAANFDCNATENAILAGLNHPAIPKTLGIWAYNGRSYLAREYFGGDDLSTCIRKRGTLGREQLTDIALELCDILSYIHSQNPAIIHRDIKPENIIISDGGSVKLTDFGSARSYRPETERDTYIEGTKPYMAPEQFGSEQTDNRADIYSLGMVMVFLAVGRPDKRNLKADFPYKELLPVIRKCIKRDRERRYKTAASLKRGILRARHRTVRKILLGIGVCAVAAAAFAAGLFTGEARGFINGVDSIMNIPTDKNRRFTQEELDQLITFENWYLDTTVRLILNKQEGDPIYRREVNSLDRLRIFGTLILHPDLEDVLIKTHTEKGAVSYATDQGWWIDARGDISSLDEIPNMYYLRELTMTSHSVSDLSPLSGMRLEAINLTDNFVGNLLPIKDMVTLRELDMCQNPLQDLTPISRLLSLELLDVSQTQITDLSPLERLLKLETLRLIYCDVKDISVLAKLPNLREVDLSYTLVTDLSPLIRPDNPITVRCVGLKDGVADKFRDNPGIVIVEE